MTPSRRLLVVLVVMAAACAAFLFLEWIGGSTYPLDVAALRAAGPWRAAHPELTWAIIIYTQLGSGIALLLMTAAGSMWLWLRRQRRRALFLLLCVLAGRIGIELIKLLVDRDRPGFDVHPVAVHSQSFPSGHAGNSMLTFLALALFVAPERWRRPALVVAALAAFAMGTTRPLLGVHWPSDVLAGWLFGAALALLAWTLFRTRAENKA